MMQATSTVRGVSSSRRLSASRRSAACAAPKMRNRNAPGSAIRLRFARERLAEHLDRHLCRDIAVGVAAQAVGDRQQHAFGRAPVRDPVLVLPALADARVLGDRELHCAAILPSLSPISAFCSAKTLCGRSRCESFRHQSTVSSSWGEYFPFQARRAGTSLSSFSRASAG
jgi:hypothetical protein